MGNMFHWGYGFDYALADANSIAAGVVARLHVGRSLISGWCWVLAAMRQLLGPGENEDGSSVASADAVRDTPSRRDPAVNDTLGAFRTARPKETMLQYLIVAYSADYTEESEVELAVTIRDEDFPQSRPFWSLADPIGVVAQEMRYDRENSVHDQIHADLATTGGFPTMLTKNDSSVDMVFDPSGQGHGMATPQGLAMLAKTENA
jgi:hypothetical protein